MSQRLEDELEELQLSQYYEAFVDQGFDTWDTILDITESDLYVFPLLFSDSVCQNDNVLIFSFL